MRRSLPRPVLTVTAVALLATSLSGCGSSDETATLRLGYFPNITHAPALVGVENGIFADALGEDVELETSTFNAGPSAIEALFSGAIDATYIGPNPAINGWSQSEGAALRIIAGTTSGGAALAVRDGIESIDDLPGTTLATPQLANTQDVALRYWLQDNGLSFDEEGGDVAVIPTDNAEVVGAFADGAIDGAWLPEPHLSRLILEHGAHVLQDETELWPDGEFVTTHLIVRTEFAEENPDLVTALLNGHVAAVDHTNDNTDEAKQAANDHLESLTGKPLPDEVLDTAFDNLTFTVDPIASSLAGSAEHAEAVGLLDPVDLKGIYDLDALNAILREDGREEVGAGDLGT